MIEGLTDKLLVVMNFIEKNVRKRCLLICFYAIEHCVVIRHLHGVNTQIRFVFNDNCGTNFPNFHKIFFYIGNKLILMSVSLPRVTLIKST